MKKQKKENEYDLVIVGGGSSGMMCGIVAAKGGAKVLIIEKNSSLGNKLRITGGGRCNITNAELDIKKFLENFPEAKKFLYSPFSKFSSKDTFSFFEKAGLPIVTEARKRAFPKSQKAYDVFNTMEKLLKKFKVDVIVNSEVVLFKRSHADYIDENTKESISSVKLKSGREIFGDSFAIATGGMAAPKTGSTGDGFKFLRKLDHVVENPNPNIVPLTTDSQILQKISGTS
jgi:predicted Rossmann fold flavoprotein